MSVVHVVFAHPTGLCGAVMQPIMDDLEDQLKSEDYSLTMTALDFDGHGQYGGKTVAAASWLETFQDNIFHHFEEHPTISGAISIGVGLSAGASSILSAQLQCHLFDSIVVGNVTKSPAC